MRSQRLFGYHYGVMPSLEDRIVAAMVRLTEAEQYCERHMFVFPVTKQSSSLGTGVVDLGRVVEDDVVMLVCRDASTS